MSISINSNAVINPPCIHRGEMKRIVECPTCNKDPNAPQWKVKLFSCAIHFECTTEKSLWRNTLGRYYTCEQCPNRVAPGNGELLPMPPDNGLEDPFILHVPHEWTKLTSQLFASR